MTVTSEVPLVESHYQLVTAPKPRPSDAAINEMLAEYYGELSAGFDEFNSSVSFGAYLSTVNSLVAGSLTAMGDVRKVLSIGAGTGTRELAIRESSGLQFEVTCVDTSPRMCELASKKGFIALCGDLPDLNITPESFDACLFLNAFEVLTSRDRRLQYLRVIHRCLQESGRLFVDAMDIENVNDAWAAAVKQQFVEENLQQFGYEPGDCFCRRADQQLIVFAHYFNHSEMEKLIAEADFRIRSIRHVAEDTGELCEAGHGQMFFEVEKVPNNRIASSSRSR